MGLKRMGTAFPHKKLSGNGVSTREILRYIYMVAIKIAISHCYNLPCYNIPCTSNHVINFAKYQRIKTNFQGYMLHLYGRRVVSQNP